MAAELTKLLFTQQDDTLVIAKSLFEQLIKECWQERGSISGIRIASCKYLPADQMLIVGADGTILKIIHLEANDGC